MTVRGPLFPRCVPANGQTDGLMDLLTDQRKDRPSYRYAKTHLKKVGSKYAPCWHRVIDIWRKIEADRHTDTLTTNH